MENWPGIRKIRSFRVSFAIALAMQSVPVLSAVLTQSLTPRKAYDGHVPTVGSGTLSSTNCS